MITKPDDALEAIMEGNRRFADGSMLEHDLESARQSGTRGQRPFAAVIRCADSRVAPEIVFDQTSPSRELYWQPEPSPSRNSGNTSAVGWPSVSGLP